MTSDAELVARLKSYSPFLISHVGQHLLMPVLWAALEREPLVDFRRGTSVERVRETSDGIVVDIQPRLGLSDRVAARYVVAADGANSVLREHAGIGMTGKILARIGSVFFHAPACLMATRPRRC